MAYSKKVVEKFENVLKEPEKYSVGRWDPSEMDIGTAWELWEHRRQYDGIDFHPYDDRSSRYDDDVVWDLSDLFSSSSCSTIWQLASSTKGLLSMYNAWGATVVVCRSPLLTEASL